MAKQSIVLVCIISALVIASVRAVQQATVCRKYQIQSTHDLPKCEGQSILLEKYFEHQYSAGQIDQNKLQAIIDKKINDSIKANKARQSCSQIKEDSPDSDDGLYKIRDLNANEYNVYCDMTTDAGGWTLVASIHENNIGQGNEGKCTTGDRWSSEQGNSAARLSGDGNWQNQNIFGFVTAATSDDYKNPAYFEMEAKDVMIWQVPNETPLRHFNTSSYLKYRTTNGFLAQYGGNLFHLYNDHYPIKSNVYNFPSDSGPAIPVVFDKGDRGSLLQHFPPNAKPGIEPGYIQFRAISVDKDAFALCPGIRNKPTFINPSQSCLGSAGKTRLNYFCGDFSGLVHDGHAFGKGWSADEKMVTSTFLIFYR